MVKAQILDLSSDRLLETKVPEMIFTNDLDAIKSEFRKLAAKWHPDHCKESQAGVVFAHVRKLYEEALEKIANGAWLVPGLLTVRDKGGKAYRIRYRKNHPFELGESYIADTVVVYVVKPEYEDLFRIAERTMKSFTYRSDEMREQVERYLPAIQKSFVADNGDLYLVVSKTPDLFLLRDLLDYFGGTIDPKHVAWIQSSLHNLACYFEVTGLTHNNISPDTYFVSPLYHSGALLGGWWYAALKGEKMPGANARSFSLMPPDVKASKLADNRTDLEMIRATGRELLGDLQGVKLLHDAKVPKPLADWLTLPSQGHAVKEYRAWSDRVLIESFGKRKFVKMEVSADDIYR